MKNCRIFRRNRELLFHRRTTGRKNEKIKKTRVVDSKMPYCETCFPLWRYPETLLTAKALYKHVAENTSSLEGEIQKLRGTRITITPAS